MATFKELSAADIKTSRSFLNQLVDIIQEDISGSTTRRAYQVFVTGGIGPGVTSSLFQTVYDQDFTLQTANPVFDVTVGTYYSSSYVLTSSTGEDAAGKLLFPSESLMMREKIYVHEQFAQLLLGNSKSQFATPFGSSTDGDMMESVLFLAYKRLFARDKVKRETYAMKFYQSASNSEWGATDDFSHTNIAGSSHNIAVTSVSGAVIFSDIGSAGNKETTFGGEVGNIVDTADTTRNVGLLFYDRGIAVYDLGKIISGSQHMTGVIDAMSTHQLGGCAKGKTIIGHLKTNPNAKFIPDFMVSGSMDNIIDHVCSTRFSSGTLTAMTFQNITNINSTLIFCRATADEFNYSSNPTYVNASDEIVVIDSGQEDTQRSFTFVSTVGLYDANNNLLAVAKLSRPVEKNDEKDLTLRVRLDF